MKVLVIEDERLAAEKLIDLILEYDQSVTIVNRLKSVEASVDWLHKNDEPELIFSDIELLDGRCFEIFDQVDIKCPIVFTTAYDQYAIKAFEANGISYLLKPVTSEKIKSAFEKLGRLKANDGHIDLSTLKEVLATPGNQYKKRFLVKVGQKIRSIPVADISYFFTQDKLTFLVTPGNDRYPLDQPLDELEDSLDPQVFFRLNRKYLARIESIAEIHPYFKGRVKLALNPAIDDDIVVSSDKTPLFKAWLDQ